MTKTVTAGAVSKPQPPAGRALPLSVAVITLPAVCAVTRLLLGIGRPFTSYGDGAILEAAVRQVASGTQTLGPYSRFGFHQPGPAYFFAQAPFSWLTGASSRSLFLGATAINLGSAVASVLVVRRQFGEPAARWAAALVTAYLLCVTPALVTDAWNPYVLGMPLLLTIVLAAAGAAGSLAAGAGALVVGSYVVQTHLATAITLVAVGIVAAATGIRLRRHNHGPPDHSFARRRPWVTIGVAGAFVTLLWAPPLIEQVTGSPGNLTRLARFFGQPHPEDDAGIDHTLGSASTQVIDQLATVPFGPPPDNGDDSQHRSLRTAAVLAGLAAAGAAVLLGSRRRHTFVVTLGAVSLAGCFAAVWSTTRIVGEVKPYLLVWAGVLLIPGWLGLGLIVRPPSGPPGRWSLAVAAGSLGLGAVLAWSMLRAPLPPVPDNPDVAAAADLFRTWIRAEGAREVRIRFAEHDRWPQAVGVVNRLDRQGVRVRVDREWTLMFGDQFKPSGREAAELWITSPAATPPVPGGQRLGATANAAVWAAK